MVDNVMIVRYEEGEEEERRERRGRNRMLENVMRRRYEKGEAKEEGREWLRICDDDDGEVRERREGCLAGGMRKVENVMTVRYDGGKWDM
ncbi:hypothetical protein Pmani_022045 [Petrolisthes manimaculis]|uniref:Uncharacterized protein n=1 Tax=Petrolisthes manimaculis TaxID=1843537 RepID=A0AAE1U4N3_9EUCA|nr:hypothetical protein Pmani_022045 [Petrolisthes manimaculis]